MNWTTKLKSLCRRPSALERAAKELGQIEHSMLDVTAEIMWAEKRLDYYVERTAYLKGYIKECT